MSDKKKASTLPPPKNVKPKRAAVVSATPSSSKTRILPKPHRPKALNTTIAADPDVSVMKTEALLPEFDDVQRQVAYGKFLRAMLQDCVVDEKIEREETQLDKQMVLLADRFQKSIDQLDKTNRRMKDISFAAEHKRLMLLKSNHCDEFYKMTDESKAEDIIKALNTTEENVLDNLRTKNIDFGYTKESGHKQLLDAVNDAIEGFEDIKKHSKLDINKFKEYEKSECNIEELEKERLDLESLKSDFDAKYPQLSKRLLREASVMIANMMNDDNVNDDDDDDD